jgi:transitional endoplasmic reticulum ATPase
MPRKMPERTRRLEWEMEMTTEEEENLRDLLERVPLKHKVPEKVDKVSELTDLLTQALEERASVQSGILRQGKVISIPEFMSLTDAANTIVDWERSMEDEEEKVIHIHGHVDELLRCAYKGITEAFGKVVGTASYSFFGKIPGQSKTIEVDFGKTESVPIGKLKIPGVPIQIFINPRTNDKDSMNSEVQIVLGYLKKFEPLADDIQQCILDEVKRSSIFKGKAVNSGYSFIDTSSPMIDKLVYSEQEGRDLDTHIFGIIRNAENLERHGISLKRTILLHGKYGTGKTLTALAASKVCLEHGWTFMNVLPGHNVVNALNFAKKYEPCMVFFEDIDQVTGPERDGTVDEILNTIDGLLAKNSRIVTILTTNHQEKIQKAMLRPGRIDAVIELGHVDKVSLQGLINAYCSESVNGLDVDKLMEAAEGYTPSFIAEACNRSLMYAISRNGTSSDIEITTEDLKASLQGLRSQFNLMTKDHKQAPTHENLLRSLIGDEVKRSVDVRFLDIDEQLTTIIDMMEN